MNLVKYWERLRQKLEVLQQVALLHEQYVMVNPAYYSW